MGTVVFIELYRYKFNLDVENKYVLHYMLYIRCERNNNVIYCGMLVILYEKSLMFLLLKDL